LPPVYTIAEFGTQLNKSNPAESLVFSKLICEGMLSAIGELLMVAERGQEALELCLSMWGIEPDG
jgi:hypothetical protein